MFKADCTDLGSIRVDDLQGHCLSILGDGPAVIHPIFFGQNGTMVTARAYDEYPEYVRSIPNDATVIEVGAGLGNFMPTLTTSHQGRLIVIDPFDYSAARRMLEFAKGLSLTPWQHNYVEDLIDRCDTYLKTDKIQLVSSTLGQSLQRHPQLEGTADIVVDFFGPMIHPGFEGSDEEHVENLERRLLKPTGALIFRQYGGRVCITKKYDVERTGFVSHRGLAL